MITMIMTIMENTELPDHDITEPCRVPNLCEDLASVNRTTVVSTVHSHLKNNFLI
jgi:hypothetical protein